MFGDERMDLAKVRASTRSINILAFIFLLLVDLGGDSVEIPAALRGETAASVGVLFDHLDRLQSLESFAGDRSGTPAQVAGHQTVVGATSVDLADGRDSDGRPDVDVTGQGSAPGVIPVLVVGSELLRRASLHNVHPLGELHLAAPKIEESKS